MTTDLISFGNAHPQDKRRTSSPPSITIGGHEVVGELSLASGLGLFRAMPLTSALYITTDPLSYYAIDPESHMPSAEPLLTVSPDNLEHLIEILKLSLKTFQHQYHYYQIEHFRRFIREFNLIEERETISKLDTGAALLMNGFKAQMGSFCLALNSALEISVPVFHAKYLEIISKLDQDYGHEVSTRINVEDIVTQSIEAGKLDKQTKVDHSAHIMAHWVAPIIKALWKSHAKEKAYKSPVLKRNNLLVLLDVSGAPTPDITQGSPRLHLTQDAWIDPQVFTGIQPAVVERILSQHKEAFVIDIVKLLLDLWTEHPEIQRTKSFEVKRRYVGLTELLHQRYGIANNNINQAKVADACAFLNALRFGPTVHSAENFVSIEGLSDTGILSFTYLKGLRRGLEPTDGDHERIVPILNHPQGKTRNRAHYNRLGLAISGWLVDHSHTYFITGAVPFDNTAFRYLNQRVGFSRRTKFDRAIDAFAEADAITLENGMLRLGGLNKKEELCILNGANNSIQAAKRGNRRQKKRGREQ